MFFIELLVWQFEGQRGQEDKMLDVCLYRFHSSASVALSIISDLILCGIIELCNGSNFVWDSCMELVLLVADSGTSLVLIALGLVVFV
jgi:hypothetical protein